MSATQICLQLALCFMVFINIECSVIKMQEIPLKPGVVMKIVVKDDPKNKDSVIASIRIGMEDKKKTEGHVLSKLINSYVKPSGDFIPKFDDRHSILNGNNGNCGNGQVRRGPLCVNV